MLFKKTGVVVGSLLFLTLMTLGPAISAAYEPEGTLIGGRAQEARYYDPNHADADQNFYKSVSGSLIRKNTYDGTYSRNLAESWENLDPKTWKFNLRKGVKFHNGQEVTAKDVKYSFERTMGKINPKYRGLRRGVLKKQIASIETPDDYTVIIKTKYPDASFLGIPMILQIVPKAYVEKLGDQQFAREPVGFGPWKMTEIKVAEYVKLEAFESYWNAHPKLGEMGRAKVKNVILRTLPHQATLVAALKAGEIDVMYGVQADTSKELKQLPDITVYHVPAPNHYFYVINSRFEKDPATGQPSPLRDVRVRQALNYALDIDSVIENYLTGEEKRTTLVGRFQIGYDPNTPLYPYDPEKAKKLLAEAGYSNGFALSCHYVDYGRMPSMDAIWEYWRAIGIKVVPKPHSFAVTKRGVIRKKSYGVITWVGGYGPDPGNWFRAMVPYNSFLALHHRNDEAERLFKKQSVEFDVKKRVTLIRQLNQIFLKEAWFIPTYQGVNNTALNTRKWTVDRSREPLVGIPLTAVSRKK